MMMTLSSTSRPRDMLQCHEGTHYFFTTGMARIWSVPLAPRPPRTFEVQYSCACGQYQVMGDIEPLPEVRFQADWYEVEASP